MVSGRTPKPPWQSMRAKGRAGEAAPHVLGAITRSAIAPWPPPPPAPGLLGTASKDGASPAGVGLSPDGGGRGVGQLGGGQGRDGSGDDCEHGGLDGCGDAPSLAGAPTTVEAGFRWIKTPAALSPCMAGETRTECRLGNTPGGQRLGIP